MTTKEHPSVRALRVANATAAFKSIVLPYPRQNVIMEELEQLRLVGLATKGLPQDGTRLLAETGSGKTFGALRYRTFVESQPGREKGSRPVLLVRMRTTGTSRSLAASILDAMGDDYSVTGSEQTLLKRVYKAFEKEKTELLIIDEVHHLDNQKFGPDVTNTIKSFLDEGRVTVAFLGTHDADAMFARNSELNGRLLAPCSLPPLKWADEEDCELFTTFAQLLDAAIVEKKILPIPAGLAEPLLAERLCKASNGIIGQLCKIVRTAMTEVVKRNGNTIEYDDLRNAVTSWSIPNGFQNTNVFNEARP